MNNEINENLKASKYNNMNIIHKTNNSNIKIEVSKTKINEKQEKPNRRELHSLKKSMKMINKKKEKEKEKKIKPPSDNNSQEKLNFLKKLKNDKEFEKIPESIKNDIEKFILLTNFISNEKSKNDGDPPSLIFF